MVGPLEETLLTPSSVKLLQMPLLRQFLGSNNTQLENANLFNLQLQLAFWYLYGG